MQRYIVLLSAFLLAFMASEITYVNASPLPTNLLQGTRFVRRADSTASGSANAEQPMTNQGPSPPSSKPSTPETANNSNASTGTTTATTQTTTSNEHSGEPPSKVPFKHVDQVSRFRDATTASSTSTSSSSRETTTRSSTDNANPPLTKDL
ncbi:hypothetical protein BDF22DRAFT_671032 [Syncephalis plumigaleata]|nr:hypothetical protein BDF22DRAFT_671032 [Syncephalis plumigaleata]